MQAVILCAGRGTRMGDLTNNTPKPMLKIGNKNLIEHKLDILPEEIKEIILVIGYKGEVIKSYFGDSYNNIPIKYIHMDVLSGTASAIWWCKNILKDRFLVLMGDDLYGEIDILNLLEHELSIGVFETDEHNEKHMVCQDHSNNFTYLGYGRNVCVGAYVLDRKFFNYKLVKLEKSDEFGLPQTLQQATKDMSIKVVPLSFWHQVSRESDLIKVPEILIK